MAKTLLVLGNGFDLNCGLESSFEQYLHSNEYLQYWEWCSTVAKIIKDWLSMLENLPESRDSLHDIFDRITFWDLYFALPYILGLDEYDDRNHWWDIEKRLQDFVLDMQNESECYEHIVKTEWAAVHQNTTPENTYYLLLKLYLWKTSLDGLFDYNCGYTMWKLLGQLKVFEKKFGDYIYNQQINSHSYNVRAKSLINRLVGKGHELSCINTFNYTDVTANVDPSVDVWHINGDTSKPIFGIDLSSSNGQGIDVSKDICTNFYKFTKTFRRLELGEEELYHPKNTEFSRVVVFGHSLAQQDFSYYYALFNRMNFSNDRGKKNGYTVEFAYCKHGQKYSDRIKSEMIERVLRLFYCYNRDVLHEKEFRLMDILYCNGAFKFREIV